MSAREQLALPGVDAPSEAEVLRSQLNETHELLVAVLELSKDTYTRLVRVETRLMSFIRGQQDPSTTSS